MSDVTKSIWKPVGIALGVAFVLLVGFVLPAEYGKDPTGLGGMLGLTGLADLPPPALSKQAHSYHRDNSSFTLAPYESLEYKYELNEGAGLVFAWAADGELEFDFHAEPLGADEGFAESFDIGHGERRNGTYIAPFTGEHGWFWENRGTEVVTVTLNASGFSEGAREYRDNDVHDRMPPLAGSTD